MNRHIDRERHGEVEMVILRRPPANAMDIDLLEELADRFAAIAGDDGIRAVVLTGAGACFSAGLDLKAVPRYGEADQHRLIDALNRAIFEVYRCPLPVIGAINGHAIAGGLVLALCCDWRIVAAAPLQAGLTEVNVGIPFPAAAMEVVKSELTPQLARQLVLSGENIDGAAALAAGVFDQSAAPESLRECALAKARAAAQLPRSGYRRIKASLRRASLSNCLAALDGAEPLHRGWLTAETIAAAAAVLKRPQD